MPAVGSGFGADGLMSAPAASLSARDVGKRYDGTAALVGVSLEVEPGECLALVGESGAGKTTLLRCFNRMVSPDAGEVRVGGRPVACADPVALRRSIGYVQQDGGLLPHWTVVRNTATVPWLRGDADAGARASESLALVGLPPDRYGRRWPRELSGGERQRVAIARALAGRPGVLLMDEPFGALDAITRADLHEAFLDLRQRVRSTCVLVTHDLGEAFRLAGRIAVMRAGRVEQVGTPAELRAAADGGYVRALLQRAGLA